jgi:ferritin
MIISKKLQDAINTQINHEFSNAYLYLAMSGFYESKNLKGFAHWMRVQAKEEIGHGMRFYDFMIRRGGVVAFPKIETPKGNWNSFQAPFEESYQLELLTTNLIEKLVVLAKEEKDSAALSSLQWFIDEQVEEEENTSEICAKLKQVGDHSCGIMFLDKELGSRKSE